MQETYRILGHWIASHHRTVLALWAVVLIAAGVAARNAPARLEAGSRPLEGTASARVSEALGRDFQNPFAQSLVVAFRSSTASYRDPEFVQAAAAVADRLARLPGVARVIVPDDSFGQRFRGADGHSFAILVGLGGASLAEVEPLVEPVRAAVQAGWSASAAAGWEWHVTGQAAMIHDLNLFNAADSVRAELRALPLTLLVLLFVFGSVVSASLPLTLGVASTLLAMSIVPGLATVMPLNMLYQNIVSLLGLALGIDYSLFIVSQYREQLPVHGGDRVAAAAATLASAGVTVTYSGLTVLIGLAGLLFTPLFEMRSMGLGGMVVVAASLAVSVTLLPALLVLLTPWLDSPRWLRAFLRPARVGFRWDAWAGYVLRHPVAALVAGVGLLLVLSLPLLGLRPGFPDRYWLPASLETSRGLAILQAMGQGQELTPINLLVRAADGGPVLPGQVDAFFQLSEQIRRDTRVARVFGPVDLGDEMQEFQVRTLYLNFEETQATHPEIVDLMLSRDRRQALVQVILTDGTGYEDSLAFVRELAALRVPGLVIEVGGHWAFSNDLDARLIAAYPRVGAAVMCVTLAVLFFAFRSYLVPVKALILNTLSVTAAFGAVVAAFQWGWGAALLGLDGPTGSIPLTIPLIVYCVTFGLSMDYEVFLLARIREEYRRQPDNEAAVRRGLVATAPLISGAAAIMVLVFGAFAMAEIVLIKMLGFALVVAVTVDALVVRAVLVPATMKLAGRWNWIPGLK